MASPTLTVLMPNYNHGAFIAEALQSVASQSVEPDRILVIDDGSTDDSLVVLECLQAHIPYLEVVATGHNRGVVSTLNDLVSRADTECVYAMAADDKLLPGFFQATLELLRRYPETGMCSTLCRLIDREGADLGLFRTPVVCTRPCRLTPDDVRQVMLREGWFAQGNATVYRHEALCSAGAFRNDLGAFCDGFAGRVVALTHGACFVPRALTAWRRLRGGASFTDNQDPQRLRAIRERAVELMSTDYAGVFPPEYVDVFDKEMRLQSKLLRVEMHRMQRQITFTSCGAGGRILAKLIAITAPLKYPAQLLWLRRQLGLTMVDPVRRYVRWLIRRRVA